MTRQAYLVQWKGYTAEERTWEPAANVSALERL